MSAKHLAATARKVGYLGAGLALAVSAAVVAATPASAMTSTEAAAANATLSLLNRERAANHLPGLQMSSALISSARRHNLYMAKYNTMSHQLPGEPVFTTRISQAGVPWHHAAENIGWTTNRTSAGATGLETAMYNEVAPNNGHRLNILSSAVRYVGIDVYLDAAHGKLWLTEDFADASGPVPAQAAAAPAAHNPVGHIDAVTALAGHQLRVMGWSYDPDNKILSLHQDIYIDGRMCGRYFGPVQRPDVAAARHVGQWTGFNFTMTTTAGRHVVAVYAINVGLGQSVRLSSSTITVG